MKRALVLALAVLLVSAGGLLAQAPPMPKVGPEHKRLGYFLGQWSSEGEMKKSPFGPPGKMSFKERNEWLPGGFFVVSHSEMKGPMGEGKGLSIMGYDADAKVYTYSAFNSMGMTESSKGTVQGDTWTWNSETKIAGKPVKSRFIIKELSPTAYTYKWEVMEGKTWSTTMEGKTTKVK